MGGWETEGSYNNGGGGSNPPSLTTQLINLANSYFSEFTTNNPNIILSTNTPAGYTLQPDGSSLNNTTGETIYGVTYKSGDLVFVSVSPHIMTNGTPSSRSGLIGHELVHARNINENSTMYSSNLSQFKLESEYAAYSYQWYFASMSGDHTTAALCMGQMSDLMFRGATGSFTNNLNYYENRMA